MSLLSTALVLGYSLLKHNLKGCFCAPFLSCGLFWIITGTALHVTSHHSCVTSFDSLAVMDFVLPTSCLSSEQLSFAVMFFDWVLPVALLYHLVSFWSSFLRMCKGLLCLFVHDKLEHTFCERWILLSGYKVVALKYAFNHIIAVWIRRKMT